MKFFIFLIKVFSGALFFASLSTAGGLDVAKPLKTIKVSSKKNTLQRIDFFAVPVDGKNDQAVSEEGRLLIITAPQKKLYWWRYEIGGYPEHTSFPADQFMRTCKPFVDENELIIFCTTGNLLLVSRSNRLYKSTSEIELLVKSDFDKNGSNYNSGLDYFDKKINLKEILEPNFFSEFGNAIATQIQLGDISKANEHWQISLIGAKQNPKDVLPMRVKLKFTLDFAFVGSSKQSPDG
ncbi:hypothetical protein [Methylomonas albis]|uniref:Uncharacterized protein n=1 Tax=Methylomonas albis TaxID=1854563 RepID=A0ABR9D7V1_9GAMM|nr:hypothetical protein [Methylomonas albis]MBD9358866.1 hypothetical protein [Methylomonas albis]